MNVDAAATARPRTSIRSVYELGCAWRRLRSCPFHALAVIVNLSLGIGASVAVFSVLYGVVLRPLPYPQPERLVLLQHEMPGIAMAGEPTLFGGFQGQVIDYAEHSKLIDQIGAYTVYDAAIDDARGARYVRAAKVTAGFLQALGARPLLGRPLRDPGPTATGSDEVMLSQPAWALRYGKDPGSIGRRLRVDGADAELIGVLERQGPFPDHAIALWSLRDRSDILATPQLLVDGFIVRMAAGVEPQALRGELDGIIAGLPRRMPDEFIRRAVLEGRLRARITPLDEVVTGPLAGSLWLLMGAGALVLLAALANVTGLQLLRRAAQRREQAVRRALGARPRDLVWQSAAEAAVVAVVAFIAGLALAQGAIAWLLVAGPANLPRSAELGVGWAGVLLAISVSGAAMLLQVAVHMTSGRNIGDVLRGARSATSSPSAGSRIRSLTAAAQLALAVILLVGAGLVLRSFMHLHRVDPGFTAQGVLSFRVPFPSREIESAGGMAGATALYDRLVDRIAAMGGVESVGYGSCAPFARTCGLAGLTLVAADRPPAANHEQQLFGVLQTAAGYHESLRIPLLEGRLLRRADHQQRSNGVVVSAAVAAALWPDRSAVGRQMLTPDLPDWPPLTVVGVVGEIHHTSLQTAAEPLVYMPVLLRRQTFELSAVTFVVRASVPPLSLVDGIRAAMKELRPDIPVADIEPLSTAIRRSTARLRFAISMLVAAALATLILGAGGVYGVVAYTVRMRRREFGIRLALGAEAAHLRALVLRQAGTMAGLGLLEGFGVAAVGSGILESTLFEVARTDATTYLTVALLLVGVGLSAAYLPGQRAAATRPAEVLRDG